MKIETAVKLDFSDVLIKPKRSKLESRKDVDLVRHIKFPYSTHIYRGIPIMAANMDSVATIAQAKLFEDHRLFTCFTKFQNLDEIESEGINPDNYAVSIGLSDDDIKRIAPYEEMFRYICVDAANGYTEKFSDFISSVRDKYPDHVIIAGNVCTPEMTEQLILSGADIVKVGIGPGQLCFTRQKTGVGYPQLSAIIECADAAHGLDGRIIGDGGCVVPGDIAKGFGAGADFMMLGSMLAGHKENSFIDDIGNVTVYGMSSSAAMEKHYGEIADHRTSEGRVVKIPYRGPLKPTIQDILGSLRSACTYVGATELRSFSKCTTFIMVNNQLSRKYEKNTISD